jgi:hypothetical protein
MKLIMTLLVRDEEDILKANIDFHLAQGVDFIIATDNCSVDATAAILHQYEQQGVLRYLYEERDDYSQYEWVTRMARMAHTEYGADWVINNDADEFWWPTDGSLKDTLARLPANITALQAARMDFVPVEDAPSFFYRSMVFRTKKALDLTGIPLLPKVAHRSRNDIIVMPGNHNAAIELPRSRLSRWLHPNALPAYQVIPEKQKIAGGIEIFHFPIRNYDQLLNKIKLGGAAYERNKKLPAKMVGSTWRTLYQQYKKDGNLNSYYQTRVYSKERIAHELQAGNLQEDTRLLTFFNNLQADKTP